MTANTYCELILLIALMRYIEDGTVPLAVEVTSPEAACLRHELIFDIEVPIFILAVELEVLFLGHVIDRHYAVVLLQGMVVHSKDRVRHHLLKMMHLMDVLSLTPETIGLVDKDEILVLRVDHLTNVIEVHVLKENEDLHDVGCVGGSSQGTLCTILHGHVLVVITITVALESPAASILELLRDSPPVPIFSHPVDRGSAISSIHLKDVETGGKS